MQVDQHVDTVTVSILEQEDVLIAERLAKKGWMPKQFKLSNCDYYSSSVVTTAVLDALQHHHFFARLQRLILRGCLSEDTLQVSANAADQGFTALRHPCLTPHHLMLAFLAYPMCYIGCCTGCAEGNITLITPDT
jgi:hypothetical protein